MVGCVHRRVKEDAIRRRDQAGAKGCSHAARPGLPHNCLVSPSPCRALSSLYEGRGNTALVPAPMKFALQRSMMVGWGVERTPTLSHITGEIEGDTGSYVDGKNTSIAIR